MNTLRRAIIVGTVVVLSGLGGGCGLRTDGDPLTDGLAALRRERYQRAERSFMRAVSRNPADAGAWGYLAQAQWATDDIPAALASMRRALDLAPEHPESRVVYGFLLLAAGEYAEALPFLTPALAESPDRADVRTGVGLAHLRMGDNAAAVEFLMSALEHDRDYAPAVYNLAIYHRDYRHDPEQARTFFERYLALSPAGEMAKAARRALSEMRRDREEDTARPGDGLRSPFESASPRLMRQAQAAIQRGDLDEAYIHLRTAIRNDDRDAHALWMMAEFTEIQLQSSRRAIQFWQDFIDRFPDDPRAGEARQRLRRLLADDARADASATNDDQRDLTRLPVGGLQFNLQARRNADGARRAFERGLQYQAQADWDRAIYFFRLAFEQDDSQVNALFQLARAYENSQDPSMAINVYGYILQQYPDLLEARVEAARVMMRQGDRDRAEAQLTDVLRQRPDHADAHLLLGVLLRDEPARRDAARRHFRRYLDQAPPGEIPNQVRRWLNAWED